MTAAYQDGQKVRLTRGDEALNGEVTGRDPVSRAWIIAALGVDLPAESWESNHGWTLTPEEPPARLGISGMPLKIWLDSAGDLWRTNRRGTFFRAEPSDDDYKLATQVAPFTEVGTMQEHAEIIARWADECVGGVMPWDIRREFRAVQS